MRSVVSLATSLSFALACSLLPTTAAAQEPQPVPSPVGDLSEPGAPPMADLRPRAEQDELSAIDAQAGAATALYVTGIVLHVGGLGGAVGLAIGTFCISFGAGSCPDHRAGLAALLATSGVGLALLGVAIGLDVDSGRRRRRLTPRDSVSWGVAPLDGGAALSVTGVF
jgi:hypothetical protein